MLEVALLMDSGGSVQPITTYNGKDIYLKAYWADFNYFAED